MKRADSRKKRLPINHGVFKNPCEVLGFYQPWRQFNDPMLGKSSLHQFGDIFAAIADTAESIWQIESLHDFDDLSQVGLQARIFGLLGYNARVIILIN